MSSLFRLLLIPVATLVLPATAAVAVSSVVFNGYTRARQADGTFKPERYVFGEGGCQTRPVAGSDMEKLTFPQVARTIAAPLARLNYRPALNTAEAELLLVVFWGATEGSRDHDRSMTLDRAASAVANYSLANPVDPDHPIDGKPVDAKTPEGAAYESALFQLGMANRERDELDMKNARVLGYTDTLERAWFLQSTSMGRDVLQEISENRYYVVLQAYDFKTAAKYKKLKPMWTVRLSVSEDGDFTPALEQMVAGGSPFFGQDSGGLRHRQPKDPTVELAPLQIIETLPTK